MVKNIYPERILPPILIKVLDHKMVVFTSGFYNLNIVGVRNPNSQANKFDDTLYVIHKELDDQEKVVWACYSFCCTTDPGFYWMAHSTIGGGVAIMAHPQQCRGAYKIDFHRGKYKALCQRLKPVYVWRDGNRNQTLEMVGPLHKVNSGINIHRASQYFTKESVGRYSAGCTVIQAPDDFDIFMSLCYKQQDHGMGYRFTYTILLGD